MFSRISTTKQMKQELFLIRNNQCTAPPKPTANNSEEAPGSSNGRQTTPSVPASRSPSRSTSHTSSSPSGGSQAPPSHARSGDPPPQSTPSTPKVIPPQQTKNLFSAACNALKMDPKLLKVVLMKQIIPESFSLTPRLPMTHPYFDFTEKFQAPDIELLNHHCVVHQTAKSLKSATTGY